MQKSLKRWADCSPKEMSQMNAIANAFADAREDILLMGELLRVAAYPRAGTQEMNLDAFEVAEMIQNKIPLDDLDRS